MARNPTIGEAVTEARWVAEKPEGPWHRRSGAGKRTPKATWARTGCGEVAYWGKNAEAPPLGAKVCAKCAAPVVKALEACGYAPDEALAVLASLDFGSTPARFDWPGLVRAIAAECAGEAVAADAKTRARRRIRHALRQPC